MTAEVAKSNLAYDFEALERQYASSAVSKVRQPAELKVVEGRSSHSGEYWFRVVLIFLAILIPICASLCKYKDLTELTSQIEAKEHQYQLLQNENRLMQMELESKTSLRTVRDIAENQLGMAAVESYQIEYIDLSEGDRVVLAKAPQLSLADHIQKAYYSVLEYFHF